MYLIQCRHEVYCQGYEWATDIFLVHSDTYDKACDLLKKRLKNPKDFKNKTIIDDPYSIYGDYK